VQRSALHGMPVDASDACSRPCALHVSVCVVGCWVVGSLIDLRQAAFCVYVAWPRACCVSLFVRIGFSVGIKSD